MDASLETAPRVKKLTIVYEVFMAILALTVLVILILEYTLSLSEELLNLFALLDISILIIFAVDYFYRLYRAEDKLTFFKQNIFDLIAIIPLDKAFRIARLARLTRLARLSRMSRVSRLSRLSRLARVIAFSKKFLDQFMKLIKTNGLHYVIGVTILIILIGALGIQHFEGYDNFGDALWWSLVTTTTVGYGDISPATAGGRVLAAVLMIVGIGFLGMVTGAIATFFVDKLVSQENKNQKTVVDEQISFIKEKLDVLENLSEKDVASLNKLILLVWEQKNHRQQV